MASSTSSGAIFKTAAAQQMVDKYARTKSESGEFVKYRYGTAGFRDHSDKLESVMARVGFFAALRSLVCGGRAVGVMITASHNPECDNGVKIVDPSGDMLPTDWEAFATSIANESEDSFLAVLQSKLALSDTRTVKEGAVFVGRDTRPHSSKFSSILEKVTQTLGIPITIRDFGEVSSPQLHYYVNYANSQGADFALAATPSACYMSSIVASFRRAFYLLRDLRAEATSDVRKTKTSSIGGELLVDCANGVGGIVFSKLAPVINDILSVSCLNLPTTDVKVNDDCGAEFVHKIRRLPLAFSPFRTTAVRSGGALRLASVDGDCDRLMYAYLRKRAIASDESKESSSDAADDSVVGDGTTELRILDGDKQICLMYSMVDKLIAGCGLRDVRVGVVQTAYANGASTKYMAEVLGTKPVIAKTGVKHLHHEALKYDASIYFEANGHGTALFSNELVARLSADELADNKYAKALLALRALANQNVGDALADALICELALFFNGWALADWDAIYEDFPAVLTAIRVADRTVFETTNAEQTCVKPEGIQSRIDELCASVAGGRGFVRPSGTEDLVRVYAEARKTEDAQMLNLEIRRAVFDFAAGVGDRPTS